MKIMEKIKEFKKLKKQLETLYEKQQMLNLVIIGYKTIVDDVEEEEKNLENELNIPQIESEIIETEDEISHVSDEISIKRESIDWREKWKSSDDTPALFVLTCIITSAVSIFFVIAGVPLSIVLSVYIPIFGGALLAFVYKSIDSLITTNKIHKLNIEITDLTREKERLLESKKSYTDNLEVLQNDPRLIELNAKKDSCTTYFEETSELMNELNTAISKMEQYYTSLGLEIDRELCKSKESMIPDEEIDSILPDLKKILEAQEVEKQANKLSLQ